MGNKYYESMDFTGNDCPETDGYYIALRTCNNKWSSLYYNSKKKSWKEYEGRADRKNYTDVIKWLKPISNV